MIPIRAGMIACLLTLSSCAYAVKDCPQRPAFIGKTFDDLILYNRELEDAYDACAGK